MPQRVKNTLLFEQSCRDGFQRREGGGTYKATFSEAGRGDSAAAPPWSGSAWRRVLNRSAVLEKAKDYALHEHFYVDQSR